MKKTREKPKIVLIGDYGSGKTSFIQKLVFDFFETGHIPTIGAAINKVMLNENSYTFWDTAGQERYKSLVRLYYRQCHCVFIFYNMNDPSSHLNIINWIDTLDNFVDSSVPVVIIGTKSDMKQSEEIDYNHEAISDACSKINLIAKITISNKIDSSDDIFNKIKYSLEKASEYARNYGDSEELVILSEPDSYWNVFKQYINTFMPTYDTGCCF
jgi:small GTP-binding protein